MIDQKFSLGKMKNKLLTLFITRSEASVIAATLILFFVFASSKGFLSGYNVFNVARTSALFIFIALGQSMVILIGGMNISLGAIGGLSVVCLGYSIEVLHINPVLAVFITIILGSLLGAINGLIVTKFKLNSFVVTLATSFVFTGLVYGISKGNAYKDIPKGLTVIGRSGVLGTPYLFWLVCVVLCVLFYIFKYTVFGRKLLATGGNADAARMSGINTQKMIVVANIASGFFAALAGVLTVSWLGIAPPSAGADWMITSFAVAVIGGTALKGGQFSPFGMIFSGILIALVKNGLIMLEVNIYYEQTFLGLIILGAVMLESGRAKYMKRY